MNKLIAGKTSGKSHLAPGQMHLKGPKREYLSTRFLIVICGSLALLSEIKESLFAFLTSEENPEDVFLSSLIEPSKYST